MTKRNRAARAFLIGDTMMKTCLNCNETKLTDEFHQRPGAVDGLRGECKVCHNARRNAWTTAHYDEHTERVKDWQSRNIDKKRAITAEWAKVHPEQQLELQRTWNRAHPEKTRAWNAKRRAAKTRAAVPWADQRLIQFKYDLAARMTEATGYQWDVDHIIPLRHKLVCGLHVENNLQVITHTANIKKGNRVQL